jgi:cytoskeletal protein CcmA (bactofilin family)
MAKPIISEVKALNTFAQDTKITGKIESDGDIRLDGILDGTLNCKGRVVIGPEARIVGTIFANTAEIMGNVEGEINVADLLTLKSTALITGDLIMGRFSVEPGAKFTGICKMGGGSNNNLSETDYSIPSKKDVILPASTKKDRNYPGSPGNMDYPGSPKDMDYPGSPKGMLL